jgi:hypothetical protein
MRVSNSPCIVILTSFYLAIAFLSSYHKLLLLIISVPSTNCPSSSEVATDTPANTTDPNRTSRATSDRMELDATLSNETSNVMDEYSTKVKEYDTHELLDWIQRERPKLFTDDDDVEKFKVAKLSGNGFVTLAGKMDFFRNECHLPVGVSLDLANLAEEVARKQQGKLLSFIPYSKH